MGERQTELRVGVALLGSVLMFAGWALAVVPLFQHVHDAIIPLILGLVAFGVVEVPAGLEYFGSPSGRGNQGLGVLAASMAPAAALFAVAVVVFPLAALYRALASIVEFVGLVVYGWAFWDARTHAPPDTRRESAAG